MSSSGKMAVLVAEEAKRGRLKDAAGVGERGVVMDVERTPPVRRPLRREARLVVAIGIKGLVQVRWWYVRRNSSREDKRKEERKEEKMWMMGNGRKRSTNGWLNENKRKGWTRATSTASRYRYFFALARTRPSNTLPRIVVCAVWNGFSIVCPHVSVHGPHDDGQHTFT